MHINLFICMYVCVYIYMRICMYVYIHVYTHTYICELAGSSKGWLIMVDQGISKLIKTHQKIICFLKLLPVSIFLQSIPHPNGPGQGTLGPPQGTRWLPIGIHLLQINMLSSAAVKHPYHDSMHWDSEPSSIVPS